MKVKLLSHVRLLATPWTAAYQAPLSMGFSRQGYWSGAPLPSLHSPHTQVQILQRLVYTPGLQFHFPAHSLPDAPAIQLPPQPLQVHKWNPGCFTHEVSFITFLDFSETLTLGSLHTGFSGTFAELMTRPSFTNSPSSHGYSTWPTLSSAYPKSFFPWSLLTEP